MQILMDKIVVTAISFKRYMRRNFLLGFRDLYGEGMGVFIQMGANMADKNRQKHLSLSFATKA